MEMGCEEAIPSEPVRYGLLIGWRAGAPTQATRECQY
jgi:hypothetical protein